MCLICNRMDAIDTQVRDEGKGNCTSLQFSYKLNRFGARNNRAWPMRRPGDVT